MKYNLTEVACQREDNGKKLFLQKCSCEHSDPMKNLLCMHGLTLTQHIFDIDYKDYSVIRYFAKKGYTVWALDCGGYGRSEEYEDGFNVNTENAAKDILTAVEVIKEDTGCEKVDLMGWSWGTMTTSRAAGLRPDLIRKLVLIAPVTGGTMEAMPREAFTDDSVRVDYEFAARLFRHTLTGGDEVAAYLNPVENDDIDYEITEKEVVGVAMHNVFRYDAQRPRPQGGQVDIYTAGDNWLIDGKAVKAPTYMIRGTDDVYTTPERLAELLSVLPEGSEACTIRGAGHGLYYEKDYYQEVRERILSFLEK